VTFADAYEEILRLYDDVEVPAQRVRARFAWAYRRIMRRYYWKELLSDKISFVWENGDTLDVAALTEFLGTDGNTSWCGRPSVINSASETQPWAKFDPHIVQERQVLYEASGAGSTDLRKNEDGRLIYGIWGKGHKLHVVAPLVNEAVTLWHYISPPELSDDDELYVEEQADLFIYAASVDIWRFLNREKADYGMGRLPEALREMRAEYDLELGKLEHLLNVDSGVDYDMRPDPIFESARQQQNWREGR